MARVTVEDCLDNVDNRFQLVLVATKRARQILLGAEPFLETENDKPTVIALREIADGMVTRDILNDKPAEPGLPDLIAESEFEATDSTETTTTDAANATQEEG